MPYGIFQCFALTIFDISDCDGIPFLKFIAGNRRQDPQGIIVQSVFDADNGTIAFTVMDFDTVEIDVLGIDSVVKSNGEDFVGRDIVHFP